LSVTAGGHFRQRDIDVDLLGSPADGDFADAGNQHQFAAQLLGIADQLRIGKLSPEMAKKKPNTSPKSSFTKGRPRRAGTAGGVAHPAAQLIPDLRQLAGVVIRGDIDGDLRQTVGGN
jgi:hypothetical protein